MTAETERTGPTGIAGLLARRLADAGRGTEEAFTVAELRRSLLPYPLCRSELELASKSEYDVALLRLLHRGRLLESDDPELDDDVERELASPEPALGFLDDYAAVALRPGPRLGKELRASTPRGETTTGPDEGTAAAGRDSGGREAQASGRRPGEGGDGSRDGTGPSGPSGPAAEIDTPRRTDGGDDGAAGVVFGSEAGTCPACGGDVPGADGVRFCPHCGTGLEARRCGQCGGEMSAGWRYCPFCGSDRHG